MLLQPSCEWNEGWFRFQMTFSWAGKRIYTPADCAYDMHDAAGMRTACGDTYDTMDANTEEVPPVFEILGDSFIMRTQRSADAAFASLRGNKSANHELF